MSQQQWGASYGKDRNQVSQKQQLRPGKQATTIGKPKQQGVTGHIGGPAGQSIPLVTSNT